MKIIIMLVNYLNDTENFEHISLLDFSESQMRIVSIKLITWIKAEYKRYSWVKMGKKNLSKPLELNYPYDWCNDIKRLVEKDSRFARLFIIANCGLDFNPALSQSEKIEIMEYVSQNLDNHIVI